MGLNPKQIKAVQAKGDVVIEAGAGTGKTAVLTERYFYLVSEFGFSPLQIVAVTFTEKAAAELRHRIRELIFKNKHQLEEKDRDPEGILAELEASPIGTIHSLCAQICREHPEQAEVAPDFAILDELEGALWIEEHLESVINTIDNSVFELVPYSKIRKLLREMLDNPYASEQALQIDPAVVLGNKDQICNELLQTVMKDPDWYNNKLILQKNTGPAGDLMEEKRKTFLTAMLALEENRFRIGYLQEMADIDRTGGSKKAWGEDILKVVKNAIQVVKDLTEELLKLASAEYNQEDENLIQIIPSLKEVFHQAKTALIHAKREERVLDFNDLEVQALEALKHKGVVEYYHRRYRALLVDEFQDVSPIQGEILAKLIPPEAKVLTVGDPKQSIYRFRRADLRVFERFKNFLIGRGGQTFVLDQSYRMRKGIIQLLNRISKPLLREIHQELVSERLPDDEERCLNAFSVDLAIEGRPAIADLRICEGRMIAVLIQEIMGNRKDGVKIGGAFQSFGEQEIGGVKQVIRKDLDYSQIAVLARTHDILDKYLEILSEYGIPAVHAGGGNLLETRVFWDLFALLGFIADNTDNLSLVALLRSPFFACSDLTLAQIAEELAGKKTWWDCIQDSDFSGLECTKTILQELGRARYQLKPSQLCMLADKLTGYSAVIANLPGAEQRLADWDGCLDLIGKLEQGNEDVFTVVRKLKLLINMEAQWERPILEGLNAVNLLTIHASKGLEWNVVFLVDLCRSDPPDKNVFLSDEKYGVAVKFESREKDEPVSFNHQIIRLNNKALNDAEDCRVHYVALTRARDLLVITTPKESGGRLDRLLPGLEQADISFAPQQFAPSDMILGNRAPEPLPAEPVISILQPLKLRLSQLNATDLSIYAMCPRRFRYQKVECHPGYYPAAAGDASAYYKRIGTLTHLALEKDINDELALRGFDPTLPQEYRKEAMELADKFRNDPIYADLRNKAIGREKQILYRIDLSDIARHAQQIMINGKIDLMGEDFVLDYKTDQVIAPDHHRLQMWVYQRATGKEKVYIAYLRAVEAKEKLVCFDKEMMMDAEEKANGCLHGIVENDFSARPSPQVCSCCPYGNGVCQESLSTTETRLQFMDYEDDGQSN